MEDVIIQKQTNSPVCWVYCVFEMAEGNVKETLEILAQ